MKLKVYNFFSNFKVAGAVYVLIALGCTMQAFMQPIGGSGMVPYNNYIIFKQSFTHLYNHQDLYGAYSSEYWDLYKYTPTFAVLMAPFTILPDWLGLSLWNVINVLVVILGLKWLKHLRDDQKSFILWFSIVEMMTQLQNEQSNAFVAGLIVMAFALVEQKKFFWAVFCIALCTYVKVLGLVGFTIFVFYPQRWRAALYGLFWMPVLFLLPLIMVGWHELLGIYTSWQNMLANDHLDENGLSVMKILRKFFQWEPSKLSVQLTGAILFCIPLIRFSQFAKTSFRVAILSCILIWVVIFNHKAESPTFVIATLGAAIWFFSVKLTRWDYILMALVIFSELSVTDIFPKELRKIFFTYGIKCLPYILIWLSLSVRIIFDQLPEVRHKEQLV
jgi:hypothetical protein